MGTGAAGICHLSTLHLLPLLRDQQVPFAISVLDDLLLDVDSDLGRDLVSLRRDRYRGRVSVIAKSTGWEKDIPNGLLKFSS